MSQVFIPASSGANFVQGNLQVTGSVAVGAGETIAGGLTVNGNELVKGNLTVNGTINASSGGSGSFGSLTVSPGATSLQAATVGGTLTLNSVAAGTGTLVGLALNSSNQVVIGTESGGGSVSAISSSDSNVVLTPNPIVATGTVALNANPSFTTLTSTGTTKIGNTTITGSGSSTAITMPATSGTLALAAPSGTYVTTTTLNNNTLPASFTTLSSSSTTGLGATTMATAVITGSASAGSFTTAGTMSAGASTLASATLTGNISVNGQFTLNTLGSSTNNTDFIGTSATNQGLMGAAVGDSTIINVQNQHINFGFHGASGTQVPSLRLTSPFGVATKNVTLDDGVGNIFTPGTIVSTNSSATQVNYLGATNGTINFTDGITNDTIIQNRINKDILLGFGAGTQQSSLKLAFPYTVSTKNVTLDDGTSGNITTPGTVSCGVMTASGSASAGSFSTAGTMSAGASTLATAVITGSASSGSFSTAGTMSAGASTLSSAVISGTASISNSIITGSSTATSITMPASSGTLALTSQLPGGTVVTTTTLDNDTLPASFTTLASSGTTSIGNSVITGSGSATAIAMPSSSGTLALFSDIPTSVVTTTTLDNDTLPASFTTLNTSGAITAVGDIQGHTVTATHFLHLTGDGTVDNFIGAASGSGSFLLPAGGGGTFALTSDIPSGIVTTTTLDNATLPASFTTVTASGLIVGANVQTTNQFHLSGGGVNNFISPGAGSGTVLMPSGNGTLALTSQIPTVITSSYCIATATGFTAGDVVGPWSIQKSTNDWSASGAELTCSTTGAVWMMTISVSASIPASTGSTLSLNGSLTGSINVPGSVFNSSGSAQTMSFNSVLTGAFDFTGLTFISWLFSGGVSSVDAVFTALRIA